MENDGRRFFRVISNQVRFGCGFRTVEGRKQYFAWHGYPNRNDDFFTTTEISEREFLQIGSEYPLYYNRNQRKGIFTDRQRIPAGNTG